jgi:hypothetical protein
MNQVPDENDIYVNQYGIDIAALIQYLYEKITGADWDAFVDLLIRLWDIYSILAIILSLLFIIGFIYAKIRYAQLSDIEQAQLREEERKWSERYGGAEKVDSRWSEIQKHLFDDNPNSWRVAIIEADIYLEEILNEAGYIGVTLGEKLKSANPASFTTIQDAWEAHKIRNDIAHAGGDFVLTKRIAQETMTRYERVFREFGAI